MGVLEVLRALSILPPPKFLQVRSQVALNHIRNILSNDGEELEAVVGSNRRHEKVLGLGVRADTEVEIRGNPIPVNKSLDVSFRSVVLTLTAFKKRLTSRALSR